MARMLRLGLTGSIATGKSTALARFASHGVPVFSADAAVHELYQGPGVAVVETLFPGVTRNGQVDRAALSAALLKAPGRLSELEAAIHPLVRRRLAEFLAEAEVNGAKLAVVDIPLLYETGFDYGLDKVAVTFCDEAIQRRRALTRPGMSVEKLDAILARQLSQAEKKRRADYLIDTSGTIEDTYATIDAIIGSIAGAVTAGS